MRVTIYDRNPGEGLGQKFLALSWAVGCWFQKLVGAVDAYHGATSWDDAWAWLQKQPGKFESIQYWGHGSPGDVWLAGNNPSPARFTVLAPRVTPTTVIWFRTCSTFQGRRGHQFSGMLSEILGCVVAGHTRIIGVLQGGLHTRQLGRPATWPVTEGEFPKSWWPPYLRWGSNTITCLATKIPKGW